MLRKAVFTVLVSVLDKKRTLETTNNINIPKKQDQNNNKNRQSVVNRERKALPSIFGSPKVVSRGGPNKAVVSSETGVC